MIHFKWLNFNFRSPLYSDPCDICLFSSQATCRVWNASLFTDQSKSQVVESWTLNLLPWHITGEHKEKSTSTHIRTIILKCICVGKHNKWAISSCYNDRRWCGAAHWRPYWLMHYGRTAEDMKLRRRRGVTEERTSATACHKELEILVNRNVGLVGTGMTQRADHHVSQPLLSYVLRWNCLFNSFFHHGPPKYRH